MPQLAGKVRLQRAAAVLQTLPGQTLLEPKLLPEPKLPRQAVAVVAVTLRAL